MVSKRLRNSLLFLIGGIAVGILLNRLPFGLMFGLGLATANYLNRGPKL